MNSNESQNPSAAGQPQPAPAAPNPAPEQNALTAAALTSGDTAQPADAPSSSSEQTPPAAPPANPNTEQQPLPAPAPVQKKRTTTQDPTFGGVLGKLETLSPAEEAELFSCEQVIQTGWVTFVQVGLALARIKKNELYRINYGSFEDYCRGKWQYKLTYVYRLMSAAQLFNHLLTSCQKCKPELESQVRPLVGLNPEQAQAAWRRAVELAGNTKITSRTVQRAMQDLKIAPPVRRPARSNVSTAERRRLIDATIGELMALIVQKAAQDKLTEKLEILHAHVHALFARRATSAPSTAPTGANG